MGKRRQQRIRTVIPVRVSGIDQSGKQFAELVHTLDVSYAGARLGGLSSLPVPGSTISVQCRLKKSQFSVSWVGQPGSPFHRQAGLRNLEPQRDLFGASLKNEMMVDDYSPANESGPPPDNLGRVPARATPPSAPAPPSKSATLAKRLSTVTAELEEMDKLMQSGTVNPEVLGHFREAASRVRTTAWALQQWMDLEQGQKNPLEVLSYLNAERIAVATRLCESLHHDLQKAEVSLQKEKLQVLLAAVEKLFTRLAAMDLAVLAADPEDLLADPAVARKPRASERP